MNNQLKTFFSRDIGIQDFAEEDGILEEFVRLDDYDLWETIKIWDAAT